MLNRLNTTKTAKRSSRFARRERKLISINSFARLYQGHFVMKKKDNIFYIKFSSKHGTAQAFGDSFMDTYQRLLLNFHTQKL